MPLQLRPLPRNEWATYFSIAWTAFNPGIMEAMFPDGYSQEARDHNLASLKRNVDRHPERYHLFKVEDTSLPDSDPFGKAVGVSNWQIFPIETTDDEIRKEEAQSEQDDKEFGDPPGRNNELIDAFGAAVKAKKEVYVGRKPYVLLQVIGTRAGYERRGIAGMMLAWGTEKADELALPAYLDASDKGVELYKRWGFEALDKLDLDAREYGYHEPLTHTCMLRQPKEVKA